MKALVVPALLVVLVGCATYQSKVHQSKEALRQGRYHEAIEQLQALVEKEKDDKLVYLLDYATALQMAGRLKESTQAYLDADRLMEINDYHSVSNIVTATLGSEEMIQYKGESFEKYLVNVMLALNFLSENNLDSAMVEARRINEKLSKMKMEGRKPFELSPFANYLSATIWEADKKYDDAYIDFERAYKLDPSIPVIGEDLIRTAFLARRTESLRKWQKQFPDIPDPKQWVLPKATEVIIIVMQGWGPKKVPRVDEPRFPTLVASPSETKKIEVWENLKKLGETQVVYNIEKVAMETLAEDYSSLAARRFGAVIAKEVVADQIRQKDEALGALAWFIMHASDRADLRQWSTLPASIQIKRIQAKPGSFGFTLRGIGAEGAPTGESHEVVIENLKPGEKRFIVWRAQK